MKLIAEYIDYLGLYRLYNPARPGWTVAYEKNIEDAKRNFLSLGCDGVVELGRRNKAIKDSLLFKLYDEIAEVSENYTICPLRLETYLEKLFCLSENHFITTVAAEFLSRRVLREVGIISHF